MEGYCWQAVIVNIKQAFELNNDNHYKTLISKRQY